jgi:hypothetical protein
MDLKTTTTHNVEQKSCYSANLHSKKFSCQYNLNLYFIFKTLLFSTSVFQLLKLRFLFKISKIRLVLKLYSFVLELCFCLTEVQNHFLCIFVFRSLLLLCLSIEVSCIGYLSIGSLLLCAWAFVILCDYSEIPWKCKGTGLLSDCERNQYKNLCLDLSLFLSSLKVTCNCVLFSNPLQPLISSL